MTRRSVLVSGASVTGPALAHWLTRSGVDVTVVERAASLREEGQNVDVRGAGREVVRRMGLEDAVLAAGTTEEGTAFVDDDGRPVAVFPKSDDDTSGATAEMEVLRGDLARLLDESAGDGVERVFGDSVSALDDDGDGVDVTFASGAQRRFDAVLVAEGARSRTRDLVLPGADLRHLGMYTAYLAVPRTADDDRRWRWYTALGGRSVNLRPDAKGTTRALLSFMSDTRGLDHLERAGQVSVLRSVFAGVGWEAPRVLAALDDAPFYFEDVVQVRQPAWSRGRIALAGDAAHCASPVSGMGTTLGLVGAYVLAGELATAWAAGGDHRAAFAAYEARMRPYVAAAQKLPPGTPGVANPRSRAGRTALWTALRVAASPVARRLGGLGSGLFTPPADAFELPRYAA